jgi:hypothetical protein
VRICVVGSNLTCVRADAPWINCLSHCRGARLNLSVRPQEKPSMEALADAIIGVAAFFLELLRGALSFLLKRLVPRFTSEKWKAYFEGRRDALKLLLWAPVSLAMLVVTVYSVVKWVAGAV